MGCRQIKLLRGFQLLRRFHAFRRRGNGLRTFLIHGIVHKHLSSAFYRYPAGFFTDNAHILYRKRSGMAGGRAQRYFFLVKDFVFCRHFNSRLRVIRRCVNLQQRLTIFSLRKAYHGIFRGVPHPSDTLVGHEILYKSLFLMGL